MKKVTGDGDVQKTAGGVIQRQKYRGWDFPWQRQERWPKIAPGGKMLSMAYTPPGAMSLSIYTVRRASLLREFFFFSVHLFFFNFIDK